MLLSLSLYPREHIDAPPGTKAMILQVHYPRLRTENSEPQI